MKYIKTFEDSVNYIKNDEPDHDIIGAKIGDIVICTSSLIAIEKDKRYEILEILDHENEHKKDIVVKNSEDLLVVKDAETNEGFWVLDGFNERSMRKFYAWRFIPEYIHNANKYNV